MPKFLQHEVLTLEALWDELVFSEARLRYDENGKDLVEQVAPLCDKVLEIRVGQLNSWKQETLAQAGVAGANTALDSFTLKFERVVRRPLEDAGVQDVGQDPRYKAYFPEPVSRIVGRALRSQLEVTKLMLSHLRAEKSGDINVSLPTMELLFAQGVAALDEQQRVETARRNYRNESILPLFEEANKVRKLLFGTLTTREAERNQSKGWAEGFFRKSSRAESDMVEIKQDAISLMFKAKGITLSKETEKKLFAETDLAILDHWLSMISTINKETDLFAE